MFLFSGSSALAAENLPVFQYGRGSQLPRRSDQPRHPAKSGAAVLPADERPAAEPHQGAEGQIPLLVLDHGVGRRTVPSLCARSARLVPRTGCHGMRGVPGRDLLPLAGITPLEGGFRGAGETPYGPRAQGVRDETHGLPKHGADLLRPNRRNGRPDGVQDHPGRRRQTRAGLEIAQLRLCQRTESKTARAAAQLQAVGRHRLPFLEPQLERMAADGRQVRRLDRLGRYGGRGGEPLHGLRDLRRAPEGFDGHLRFHEGAAQSGTGHTQAGIRHRERGGEEVPARGGAPLPARDVVGRRGARRHGMAGQRVAKRSLHEAIRPER